MSRVDGNDAEESWLASDLAQQHSSPAESKQSSSQGNDALSLSPPAGGESPQEQEQDKDVLMPETCTAQMVEPFGKRPGPLQVDDAPKEVGDFPTSQAADEADRSVVDKKVSPSIKHAVARVRCGFLNVVMLILLFAETISQET